MANCYLTENIKSSLDKGNVVGAVFIDLKQAFDTVNHEVLLNKLSTFNFSDQATGWFPSRIKRAACKNQCRIFNPLTIYNGNSTRLDFGASALQPIHKRLTIMLQKSWMLDVC